jgi:hypothetical protein
VRDFEYWRYLQKLPKFREVSEVFPKNNAVKSKQGIGKTNQNAINNFRGFVEKEVAHLKEKRSQGRQSRGF